MFIQAKKNPRIADYSLDDENYRTYQQRANQSQKKADEIGKKVDETVANSGESGIIKTEHNLKGKYSISFGKLAGEKPLSKTLAQAYSQEYDKFVEKFGNLNDVVTSVDVKSYKGDGIYGGYNDNSGVLVIYGAGGKDGILNLTKVAKEHKKSGLWSTSLYLHTSRHELGHALQNKLSLSDELYSEKILQIEKLRQSLLKKTKNLSVEKSNSCKSEMLSIYGIDSLDDFISESIAEYMNGKPRKTSRDVVNILMGW